MLNSGFMKSGNLSLNTGHRPLNTDKNRTLKTEQRNARQTREIGNHMTTVLKSHMIYNQIRVIKLIS